MALPTQRYPADQGDRNTWGAILRAFWTRMIDLASGQWRTGVIPGGALEAGTVTETQLADNTVTTAKLQDTAVTAPKLASGAVTDATVAADAAIAQSKIANLVGDLAARVTNPMTTAGDLIVGGANGVPTRVPEASVADTLKVTQTGTGAVARTLGAKVRETVSVEDFGGGPTKTAAENKAAFEAALVKLTVGGARISGRIEFTTPGNWPIDGPIAIGDGVKFLDLEIVGMAHWTSANSPIAPITLTNPSAANDTFDVIFPVSKSASVIFRGLNLVHPEGATGIAFDFTNAAQNFLIEACSVKDAGIGVYLRNGGVSPRLRDVVFYGCTTAGLRVGGGNVTAGRLENVYFQSGSANGLVIDAGITLGGTEFANVVFEGNAEADILLNGALDGGHFNKCHWEAPG